MSEILTANPNRQTNADLIADVAALGWLNGLVLDATYGQGNFWTKWTPPNIEDPESGELIPGLWRNDPHTLTGPDAFNHDARSFPAWWADLFDASVFDPPYKLNGTSSVPSDRAYGTHRQATKAERLDLILWGSSECARVTKPGGWLHIKIQNQICGGRYIDIAHLVKEHLAAWADVELRAEWELIVKPRPQPPGRPQRNPRNNVSKLLSFHVYQNRGGVL